MSYPIWFTYKIALILPVLIGLLAYRKSLSKERGFLFFWCVLLMFDFIIPELIKGNTLWLTGMHAIIWPTILIRICIPEGITPKKESQYYFVLLIIVLSCPIESVLFGATHFNVFATISGSAFIIYLSLKSMKQLSYKTDTKELPPIYYITILIACYQVINFIIVVSQNFLLDQIPTLLVVYQTKNILTIVCFILPSAYIFYFINKTRCRILS